MFYRVLSTIKNEDVEYLLERSGVCGEGMFESIVKTALQRDRAVFTSEQRCRVSASQVSGNGPPLVWPLTGGCTKMVQVAYLIIA